MENGTKWILQDAKRNPDFDNQLYYAISVPHSFDIIGFYYPYSGLTEDERNANAQLMASAPELLAQRNELLEAVKKSQEIIDIAIIGTPTSELRDRLTEANILSLTAITNATKTN